jgi:Met-zincin
MNHVAAIVGGYNSQQKHVGQTGVRFQLIPRARQEGAVKFLADNAFKAPAWALNAEILRRIEPVGVLDRIEASQTRVLNALLSSARVQRLVEQDAIDGAAAYAPLEFLGDVRRGVWSEIYVTGAPKIDAYRRNLQRAYVETLGNRVNGSQAQSDDARAFFRGELKTLDNNLAAALPRQPDRATQLHIEDVRMQIARALDPSVQASSPGARTSTELADDSQFDVTTASDLCWPDYAIVPRSKRQ